MTAITLTAGMAEVLAAAADNDLYRVCAELGTPATFRTHAGHVFPLSDVLHVLPWLGPFQPAETLPDGTWVERIDLNEAGLDLWLGMTS